jgi:CHAD domain-containing protein
MTDSAAVALQLSGELAKWPRFTRDNLHPFRLKVKELRNVLRLSADSGELVKVLGDVKDSIGEWHDWMELSGMAEKVLKDCNDCDVVKQIYAIANTKLDAAMKLATQVREEYFSDSRRGNRRRSARAQSMKQPVLVSMAKLTS